MVIDFHTHCFPDKLAERAVGQLSRVGGGLMPYSDGTLNGLRQQMALHNIDISVVLNIATKPEQQTNVNNFAATIDKEPDIIAFGSVFPGAPDAFEELERIKELGLKGVKFHPEYQQFAVDDPRWKPLYRKISDLGLITVFHSGVDYGFPPPYGCMPDGLASVLDCFETPVVAAHWGGLQYGEDVLRHLLRLRPLVQVPRRDDCGKARCGPSAVCYRYALAHRRLGVASAGHPGPHGGREGENLLRQRQASAGSGIRKVKGCDSIGITAFFHTLSMGGIDISYRRFSLSTPCAVFCSAFYLQA